MRCYVYRSPRRKETYLYLPVAGDFSAIPDSLMEAFGTPELALDFELTEDRRLAKEDTQTVLKNLKERGFHLQMPPENEREI